MGNTSNRDRITVISAMGLGVLATNIVRPTLPIYLTSIGVSPEILGLMYSVSMVGMMVGEISWGWIADKFGGKLPMHVGTTLYGLIILFFVFTQNILAIFSIFLFWGLTRSALFGPGRGFIGATAPPAKKAASMAIIAVLLSASRGLGSLPSGLIADTWGYQFVFYTACGVALIGGVVLFTGLKKEHWVVERPTIRSFSFPDSSTLKRMVGLFSPLASQCQVTALFFFGFSIMTTFLPLLAIQVIEVSATEVGILFSITGFISMVLGIPFGMLADRVGKKKIIALGSLIACLAMIEMAFAASYFWLFMATIAQSVGMAMFSPASMGLMSDSVSPQQQGRAMGFYGGICEDTGIIAGSALGGFIWSIFGPQATFLAGALAAGLGVVISLTRIKESF